MIANQGGTLDLFRGPAGGVEQIKKYTVVDQEWLPGGDELTPTLKLKCKPIEEKYAAEIEAMYR